MKLTLTLPVYDAGVFLPVVLMVAAQVAEPFANPAFPVEVAPQVVVDTRGPLIERKDLEPYFASPPLSDAKSAYDVGEYTKVQELLDGVKDNPSRFLRALAAMKAQNFGFAAAEFESLAETYPALRDRCLVHAGWCFQSLRDWEGASRVFGQVPLGGRMSLDARLGLAMARRFSKDSKGAKAALAPFIDKPAPAWGRDVGAEALMALADIAQGQGDEKAERQALLAIWAKHPTSVVAEKAEDRLGEVTDMPTDALVSRAELLIDVHKNEQGLAMLTPLLESLKLPDALACRAHFAAGKALRKLREHGKASTTLGPVVKKCKDTELRAKALYTLGFSQGIVSSAGAVATYRALAKEYPTHQYADDALFFASDAHLRRDEKDEAVQRLVELVDRYPSGDFTGDALFKLFWLASNDERYDEALALLDELENRFRNAEDSYEVERAQYWKGRILERLERPADAQSTWQQLAVEHPATFYGLQARERVEAIDADAGVALRANVAAARTGDDPFPMYAGPVADHPQFRSAVELLRLGLGDLVPGEITTMDRSTLPVESLRLLVHILSLAGEERTAHGMARIWLRRDLSGPITPKSRPIWEIAYPKAFRDVVVSKCQEADELDPDLLQALMREESALDPRALSWAGALGLCQLMPATAAGVAMQLKLKYPGKSALLEPELNVQLGARYLADLAIRFNGVKPYALASYNAGEGAVARWRQALPEAPLDAWIEQIPLQETRGYVKRVLRSYNTYKLLYAPDDVAQIVTPFAAKPKPKPEKKPAKGAGKKAEKPAKG